MNKWPSAATKASQNCFKPCDSYFSCCLWEFNFSCVSDVAERHSAGCTSFLGTTRLDPKTGMTLSMWNSRDRCFKIWFVRPFSCHCAPLALRRLGWLVDCKVPQVPHVHANCFENYGNATVGPHYMLQIFASFRSRFLDMWWAETLQYKLLATPFKKLLNLLLCATVGLLTPKRTYAVQFASHHLLRNFPQTSKQLPSIRQMDASKPAL